MLCTRLFNSEVGNSCICTLPGFDVPLKEASKFRETLYFALMSHTGWKYVAAKHMIWSLSLWGRRSSCGAAMATELKAVYTFNKWPMCCFKWEITQALFGFICIQGHWRLESICFSQLRRVGASQTLMHAQHVSGGTLSPGSKHMIHVVSFTTSISGR